MRFMTIHFHLDRHRDRHVPLRFNPSLPLSLLCLLLWDCVPHQHVDSLVKPFLTVISLPLTIITLGIFQLVVNSFYARAGQLVGQSAGRGYLHCRLWIGLHMDILVSIMRSILDSIAEG